MGMYACVDDLCMMNWRWCISVLFYAQTVEFNIMRLQFSLKLYTSFLWASFLYAMAHVRLRFEIVPKKYALKVMLQAAINYGFEFDHQVVLPPFASM